MGRRKKQMSSPLARFGAWTDEARPQLTRRQVVEKALEVLNQEGFDGLTMRRLAEALGIKAASLYNHVGDKDELLTLMADAICAKIPDVDPSKPWRQQAETMGRQFRRVLMEYRDGARVLAATPPVGPQRLRLIEQLLRALKSAGFTPSEVAAASFVANSYVVGFVLDETLGRATDAGSVKRMEEQARRWFKSLPAEQYPTLVAIADELIDAPADARFEFGLRALLDGLELRLRKKGK